jgi:hypothetical protein
VFSAVPFRYSPEEARPVSVYSRNDREKVVLPEFLLAQAVELVVEAFY